MAAPRPTTWLGGMHHHMPTQALACVSAEYIMSPLSPDEHMYGGTPNSLRSDEAAVSTQRRQWSSDEDEAVRRLVSIHGTRSWRVVAENLNDRTGKQCRERWHNHLDCDIRKDAWSPDEDRMLIELHQHFGNRWADISKYLHGRTDNAVKNHWNSALRKGQNIQHLLVDGMIPSSFPNGVPPIPSAGAEMSPIQSSTITHFEAAKINNLLRASPTSSLAQLVQFPVSEGAMPSNATARESLDALLAMLRATSPSELLDATQRLNNAIGSSGDEGSGDDGDGESVGGTPPPARAVVASADDMAPHPGHQRSGGDDCEGGQHSYAPHVSSRLSAMGQPMGMSSLPTPRLAEALPSARYLPELESHSMPNSAVGCAMHQWSSHGPAPDTPGYGLNVADLLTPNSAQQIGLSFDAAYSLPQSARGVHQMAPQMQMMPQHQMHQVQHHHMHAESGRPPPPLYQQFQQQQPHGCYQQQGGYTMASLSMSTGAAMAHHPMATHIAAGEHPPAPPRSALRNKRPRGATDLRVSAGGAPAPAPISTGSNASDGSAGASAGAGTHPYPPPLEAEFSAGAGGQLQRYKQQLSPAVSYDLGVSNDAMLDFLNDTPTREGAYALLSASGQQPMSAALPLSARSPAHKRHAAGVEGTEEARGVALEEQPSTSVEE